MWVAKPVSPWGGVYIHVGFYTILALSMLYGVWQYGGAGGTHYIAKSCGAITRRERCRKKKGMFANNSPSLCHFVTGLTPGSGLAFTRYCYCQHCRTCIAIKDGGGETLYCAIAWAMTGASGVPKRRECLRIIALILVQRPRTKRISYKSQGQGNPNPMCYPLWQCWDRLLLARAWLSDLIVCKESLRFLRKKASTSKNLLSL